MYRHWLCVILFVHAALSLQASSSVWKVSSENASIYIGGTLHVLRPSDFPLPVAFDRAYKQSKVVAFEISPAKLKDPKTMQIMLPKMMLPPGKTLNQVLAADTYEALGTYCREVGIPNTVLGGLARLRPGALVMSLMAIQLPKLGISAEGVDFAMYRRCVAHKKEIIEMETLDEQIEYIVGMGEGNEDDFILYSIRDLRHTKDTFVEMAAAWKVGDRPKLTELFVESTKKEAPMMYKKLLVERNDKWLPKLESFLKAETEIFVLVGVAHLVGEEGVLQKLAKRGYTVQQLAADSSAPQE